MQVGVQVGCKVGAIGCEVERCYITANSKIVAGGRVMKVKCGRFVPSLGSLGSLGSMAALQ